jgi:hypothetical protein
MKFVNESTMFKLLLDANGLMISVTTKQRAYFFFLSAHFIGGKVAPTTDPHLGIVEVCGYDILRILRNWDALYRIKLKR